MSIDPKSDLFQAILSMDSYNRGYLSGISGLGGLGSTLGAYTVVMDSSSLVDSSDQRKDIPAGFYAVAYQYIDINNQTQTVISYRGTDQFLTANGVGGDIANAYGLGATIANVPQSRLAIEFYKSVAAAISTQNPDPYAANISVTGHSSGGGLAGLVGAIYHKSGVLFDNMAFQTAASNLAWKNGTSTDTQQPLYDLYPDSFYQLINGTNGPVYTDQNGNLQVDTCCHER